MKFEKREITLNEHDSILDVLLAHERLAELCLEGVRFFEKKEIRELFKKRLGEILDEIYFLNDLLSSLQSQEI